MKAFYFHFIILINLLTVLICDVANDVSYFDLDSAEEKIFAFDQIHNYCNVYINDLEIKLNNFNRNSLLKAFFNDHLTFECDIPYELGASNFDWSVNGLFLGINEPEYMLFLDKKIDSDDSYLNITCYYWIPDIGPPQFFNFPMIHLDKYIFNPEINYVSYCCFVFTVVLIITRSDPRL
ncbi:hypothetical protein BpHYR1_003007 [Brachionus plicatilis]|uniref:Uncharacterized protein n=1 Tax=Brachionus plicatilis TaxID=10195 RepID=A0A3M7Q9L5_BRAPC|nr:hypothetical protein BpHYR1_003007 [Brachionus plicatilis]